MWQDLGDKVCNQDNFTPALLDWLIDQGVTLGATELHIDWINGVCRLSLRVDGMLMYLCELRLSQGRHIVDAIKTELRISSLDLPMVWSGELMTGRQSGRQYEIHLIKFRPVASVIIRFCPQVPALPVWTDSPGINKKIFIWQMGKVGSLTLFNSMKPYTRECNWQYQVERSDEPYSQHNNIIHTHSAKPIFHMLHHSDEEFIVISLVRDLLQRNISAVFHNMADNSSDNPCYIAPIPALLKMDYAQFHMELEKRLRILNLSEHLLDWYNTLFKSHFFYPDTDRYHVDVYSHPFNRQKGLQIYSSKVPRIKLMIIRVEDLNNLTEEIGSFMGLDKFELRPANIAKEKWYSDIYRKFKERYSPSRQEIEHIYNSRFMNYFYGAAYNRGQANNYS